MSLARTPSTSTRSTTPSSAGPGATSKRERATSGREPGASSRREAAASAASTRVTGARAQDASATTARLPMPAATFEAIDASRATGSSSLASATTARLPATAFGAIDAARPAASSTRATGKPATSARSGAATSARSAPGRRARRAVPAAIASVLVGGGLAALACVATDGGATRGSQRSSQVAAALTDGGLAQGGPAARGAVGPHGALRPSLAAPATTTRGPVAAGAADAGASAGGALTASGPRGATSHGAAARGEAGASDEAACGHEHDAEAEAALADEALARLEVGLRADPAALAAAVEHLRATRSPGDVELLAALLGRVGGPVVEGAALELAAGDAAPWRRAAAFDLLDALDTPAALPVALRAVSGEPDVLARRSAVHALPAPVGVTTVQAREVVSTLARAAHEDQDPEVRRRAAVALGDWARRPEDLTSVVAGLIGDPSVDVRAGCAFACELAARAADPRARAALVQAMSRPDEDPLVRDNAWRALGAVGPLEDGEHLAWTSYAASRR